MSFSCCLQYVASLGMCTNTWQFTDVFGLDPEMLMMVPRPVAAVMLLYPITEKVTETSLWYYWNRQLLGWQRCGILDLNFENSLILLLMRTVSVQEGRIVVFAGIFRHDNFWTKERTIFLKIF